MVLQKIGLAGGVALEWNADNGKSLAKRDAGTKVEVVFARHQDSGVTALVTIHANIFCQARGQPSRIDDSPICGV